MEKLYSKIRAMHTIKAEMPKNVTTTMHAKVLFTYVADVPEYAEYLKTCDFDSVFLCGIKDFFKF